VAVSIKSWYSNDINTKGAHHDFPRPVGPAVEAVPQAGPGAVVEVKPVQRPNRAVVQQPPRAPRHEFLPCAKPGVSV